MRHHATKKSPKQLDREIAEALSGNTNGDAGPYGVYVRSFDGYEHVWKYMLGPFATKVAAETHAADFRGQGKEVAVMPKSKFIVTDARKQFGHFGGSTSRAHARMGSSTAARSSRTSSSKRSHATRTGRAKTRTTAGRKSRAHATKKTWTLDERTEMSRAFSRGNYANAYESTNLEDFDIDDMTDHERAAFLLGFFGSYELSEMGFDEREAFDEAYWSPAGQYVVHEAQYTDARDEDYQKESGE